MKKMSGVQMATQDGDPKFNMAIRSSRWRLIKGALNYAKYVCIWCGEDVQIPKRGPEYLRWRTKIKSVLGNGNSGSSAIHTKVEMSLRHKFPKRSWLETFSNSLSSIPRVLFFKNSLCIVLLEATYYWDSLVKFLQFLFMLFNSSIRFINDSHGNVSKGLKIVKVVSQEVLRSNFFRVAFKEFVQKLCHEFLQNLPKFFREL